MPTKSECLEISLIAYVECNNPCLAEINSCIDKCKTGCETSSDPDCEANCNPGCTNTSKPCLNFCIEAYTMGSVICNTL